MGDDDMASGSEIRVGIGGWDYDPWRETFYPPKLAKAKQLEYAASKLTAIEINATYYKLQKPDLYARWAKAVPEGFKFAIKGSGYVSNRKVLGEAGEAVERFFGQGLEELGDKLGPILWQFMTTKEFDAEDFGAFLKLLPKSVGGIPIAHVLEVGHESFRDPAFVALARAHDMGIVFADSDEHPCLADLSGPVAYARLQRCRAEEATGYCDPDLARWTEIAQAWSRGESPPGLPYAAAEPAPMQPRDTYVFMIAGAKVRAPQGAMALMERL